MTIEISVMRIQISFIKISDGTILLTRIRILPDLEKKTIVKAMKIQKSLRIRRDPTLLQ